MEVEKRELVSYISRAIFERNFDYVEVPWPYLLRVNADDPAVDVKTLAEEIAVTLKLDLIIQRPHDNLLPPLRAIFIKPGFKSKHNFSKPHRGI